MINKAVVSGGQQVGCIFFSNSELSFSDDDDNDGGENESHLLTVKFKLSFTSHTSVSLIYAGEKCGRRGAPEILGSFAVFFCFFVDVIATEAAEAAIHCHWHKKS